MKTQRILKLKTSKTNNLIKRCKSIIIFFFLIQLLNASCMFYSKSNKNFDNEHTSKNSLDYIGKYQGVLPGANSRIETIIFLYQNNQYELNYRYLDKSEEIFIIKGYYSWNAEGNRIQLEGKTEPNVYFVSENKLIQLDIDKNFITGDLSRMYELLKVEEVN